MSRYGARFSDIDRQNGRDYSLSLTVGSVNADRKLGLRQRANRQMTGMMETARLAYVVSKAPQHMSNE